MIIGELAWGIGLDLSSLDADARQADDVVNSIGQNAPEFAPPSLGAAGAPGEEQGSGADAMGARLAAGIEKGMASVAKVGATITKQLDAIGGTVVTLARRIDSSMKFPASEAALTKLQERFEGTWLGAAAGAGKLALKVKDFFGSFGDVAGKGLSQLKQIDAVNLGGPVAGARALAPAFRAVDAPVQAVQATVKGLGREIALALGAFGMVSKALEFFRDGIKGASDLAETMSKTEQIFGTSAKKITADADYMAKSFGVAKNEFMTAAGNFGAVFKGVGSSADDAAKLGNQLAKLGLDMASFDNTSNAESFTAISAALRGEFDPIEKFRVFLTADAVAAEALSSGLIKNKKELDEHAKKQATLNLILRQSSDAQGDLERTAGGAANQFRKAGGGVANFATQIGELLLPAVNTGVVAFNELLASVIDVFETNRPVIQGWAEKIKEGMDVVAFSVRNAGSIWTIAQLKATEFFVNVLAGIDTLPENFGRVTEWLGNNWHALLTDMVQGSFKVWTNLLTNAKDFGVAFWDAIQGKGFNFEFTPLLDGFKATAEAFPELMEPVWVSMQDEIDAVGAEVGKKEAARVESIAKNSPAKKAADAAGKKEDAEKDPKIAKAAELGSKDAFESIARFESGGRDAPQKKLVDHAKKQNDLTGRTNEILDQIARQNGGKLGFDEAVEGLFWGSMMSL